MSSDGDQIYFKNELKLWLKSHNLDYKWIGQQCGVSEVTVRNWMSQKTIPPLKLEMIKKIMSQILDIDSLKNKFDADISIDTFVSVNIKLSPNSYKKLETKAEESCSSVHQLISEAIHSLIQANAKNIDCPKDKKVILPD